MLTGRFVITRSSYYGFLVWNLFLAWIPYMSSVWLARIDLVDRKRRKPAVTILFIIWILFIPNAPYILTDFIHIIVQPYPSGQVVGILSGRPILWYDMILTASFAFIGHLIGLFSMTQIHATIRRRYTGGWAWGVIGCAILLSGYGIYIGRFERLNSWEVFTDPWPTMMIILQGLTNFRGILFSIAFAFFIFLTYLPVYSMTKNTHGLPA